MRSRGARGNDIWGWEAADSSDRSAPKAPLTPLATSPPAVSADNFSRNARRVSESVCLTLQVFGLYSGCRAVGIRSRWISSRSASCRITGTGARPLRVFGSEICDHSRLTEKRTSRRHGSFPQSRPCISPCRRPMNAATAKVVPAGSGSRERIA